MKINKFVSVLLVIVLSTMVVGTITVNAEDSFIDGCFTYSIDSNLGKAKIVDVDNSISGDVIIPEKINEYTVNCIGTSAFKDCDKITSVFIPDTVTDIEYSAFEGCSKLSNINIPDGIKMLSLMSIYLDV